MPLKKKGLLQETLYKGNYDKIAIWKNGTWTNVNSSYLGEQMGDQPVCFIRRTAFYGRNHQEIKRKLKNIERDCVD